MVDNTNWYGDVRCHGSK